MCVWLPGEPMTYTNWAPEEPQTKDDDQQPDEWECMYMANVSITDYQWRAGENHWLCWLIDAGGGG